MARLNSGFEPLNVIIYIKDLSFGKAKLEHDLPKLGMTFDIPIFFIHGSEDLVVRPDLTKQYFEGIKAPQKEFVSVPQTGHNLNLALVEAQYKILSRRVRPLAK